MSAVALEITIVVVDELDLGQGHPMMIDTIDPAVETVVMMMTGSVIAVHVAIEMEAGDDLQVLEERQSRLLPNPPMMNEIGEPCSCNNLLLGLELRN